MSRPIAYNASGPLSGSIRGGSVNYTVDSGNRDYTTFASKKWVPSADGVAPIVFVTDTYTQGIELNPSLAVPLFFSCNGTGSAAILYTANRIPGSPGNYSDANVALNDLINARGYFILESNDPFEGIDADSLLLDVDASKMSSYPQVGTNWIDLSGTGNNSTLTNGPTFDSNGWLVFDGVDDYSVGPGTLGSDCTVELWISSSNYNQKIPISIDGNNYGSGPNVYFTGNIIAWNTGDGGNNAFSNSSYPNAQWHHIVVTNDYNVTAKLYIDGKLIGTANPLDSTTTGTNKFWIARFHGDNNYTIAARIKSARIYNAALTEAQVKQNYFGSPIVTDGLVFAVDANNIVSYPKSGTAWYNLTGSVAASSLNNGPTFDPTNGGAIRFDGTDTYVNVPYNSSLDIPTAITVEVWVKYASQGEIGSGGRTYSVLSYKGYPWTWLLEDISGQFNFRISTTSDGDSRLDSNYYHGVERWDHVACTYNGTTQAIYVNGILQNSKSLTGTIITSGTGIELGTYSTGDYSFNGWLANHRIYNRALSAAEILQNYQAEQYRFETPAGPVTNGLVLNFDASNLDSYPGTGNTWYTLAGSDNGTLINGPSFSTEAGGCIVFDGVDDYVSFGNPLDQSQLSQVWTVQAWINITSKPGQVLIDGLNQSLWIEYYQGNNSLLYLNGGVDDYYTYGGQFTAQGWVLATFRFNNANGDRQIWRNLSNISTSGPNNTSIPSGQNSTFNIGTNGPSSTVLGKIGNLLFYNRYLTDAEITQNYNAQKGRYGL
jgi:hypothetical protein